MINKDEIRVRLKKNITIRGVYMLYRDSKIVYIGKSINCYYRLYNHLINNDVDFSCFDVIDLKNMPENDILIKERDLIKKHKPIYNIKHNEDNKVHKISESNTNIRLSKEHRDYLKKISMEQNGTPNISNGIRLLIINSMKQADAAQ